MGKERGRIHAILEKSIIKSEAKFHRGDTNQLELRFGHVRTLKLRVL